MKKRHTLRWIAGSVALAAVIIIAVVLVRTWTYPFGTGAPLQESAKTDVPLSPLSVERFAGGIRIPTVSEAVHDTVDNPFDRFKAYLPEVYPEIYKKLDTLTINRYGLLFRWPGRNPELGPLLFCSHYDVVPVLDYNEAVNELIVFRIDDTPVAAIDRYQSGWSYPPFSGAVADGRVYGRGTIDMKGMLFGILEAADALLAEGYTPERDIWFAFGFDEEIGGTQGALRMAAYFKDRGIAFDAVYDEGGIIAAPGLAGIDRAVGLVGTAEKGFCTVKIRVKGMGGHSSMPPAKGTLVLASELVRRLNDHQMPARLVPPIASFLDRVGGTMGFASRMAIANQWLLRGVLLGTLEKSPATNALVRTTTAVTMARGSDAPNVLSSVAEVVVNFRILTGESVADVAEHVKRLCEGYDTEIEVVSAREPSKISPTDTRGFEIIGETAGELYPGALVTAYLTLGGTDAYKYETVSDNVYRFMPVCLNEYEQRTIHNENEYLSLDNYARMIAYFKALMRDYDPR